MLGRKPVKGIEFDQVTERYRFTNIRADIHTGFSEINVYAFDDAVNQIFKLFHLHSL